MKAQAISTSNPHSAASRRRLHQVGSGHSAELRADEDARPLLRAGRHSVIVLINADPLYVTPFSTDESARLGIEGGEGYPVLLVGLLDSGAFQVFQDDLAEVVARAVAVFSVRPHHQ